MIGKTYAVYKRIYNGLKKRLSKNTLEYNICNNCDKEIIKGEVYLVMPKDKGYLCLCCSSLSMKKALDKKPIASLDEI